MSKPKFSVKFKFPEFILLIFLLFSGVMLAFSSGSFVLNFKKIGFSIFSTIESGVHSVAKGVEDTFGAVKELARLKKDYEELSRKLEHYEQMQRTNADIRKENERLKEQLGFSSSLDEKNIPAQIIARDTDNLNAFITINKGSVHGIKKNMPVVAFQQGTSGLVGKIVQVGLTTSVIMPIYNTRCVVSSRLQNTRDLGLVYGMGSEEANLSMKNIRKRVLDELHYGDIVVTSGENNNYMGDLPIGSISKISVVDYNSSLDIELTPIIDFSKLENVIVVNLYEINDARK